MLLTVLTFDQDWAPAWATRAIHHRLVEAGLGGTLFVTHECSSLDAIRQAGQLELAWHPNYLPGSSHGGSEDEVLATMRRLVPEAVGVRAHCLVRSTPLLERYADLGLRYEASDLMHGQPHLAPLESWNGVVRLPIYWEDDVHLLHGEPCSLAALRLDVPGLKSLTFHPILVALNSADLTGYQRLKAELAKTGRSLDEVDRATVEAFANRDRVGVGDVFERVVDWLSGSPDRGGGTLKGLVEAMND